MDLELKIKNFGPIDEAAIQVGQFTVFAGPNNTGKTFVAKMLYSILSARNENHARVFFHAMAHLIGANLQHFDHRDLSVLEKRSLAEIRKGIYKIDSILQEAFPSQPIQSELDKLKEVQPKLLAEIETIRDHSPKLVVGYLESGRNQYGFFTGFLNLCGQLSSRYISYDPLIYFSR